MSLLFLFSGLLCALAGRFRIELDELDAESDQLTTDRVGETGEASEEMDSEKVAPSLGDRLSAGIWLQEAQPLTKSEAHAKGYRPLVPQFCHKKYGYRYRKMTGAGRDGKQARLSPTLMFDREGNLAGMQVLVDTTHFPLYPKSNLKAEDMFISDKHRENEYGITLHFSDPSRICKKKKKSEKAEGSIGDRLTVRIGDSFEDIPLQITDRTPVPDGYSPSGCAPSSFAYPGSPGMGLHYWRNLKGPNGRDVSCQDTGPMFLLYNDAKKLVSVGFTFVALNNEIPTVEGQHPIRDSRGSWVMANDELWEFAQQPLYPFFFSQEENPTCLFNFNRFDDENRANTPNGTVTTGTMHVFMSDPYNIKC